MTKKQRMPETPRRHTSGQFRVRFDGDTYYLGSDEKRACDKLGALRERWRQGWRKSRPRTRTVVDLTVSKLVKRYVAHLEASESPGWFARNEPTVRHATNPLTDLHGEALADDYGPRLLKELQAHLCGLKRADEVTPRLTVKTINERVRRVVATFEWAVSEELLSENVLVRLRTVKPLKRGKPGTRDSRRVEPVAREHVDAVLPFLSKPLAAAIELLWLTGARPSEILGLRPTDIDRSATPWKAELEHHKTKHRGKARTLFFGADARRVLKPLLLRPDDRPLFSPSEGAADVIRQRREDRRTPLWPSHQRRYEREAEGRDRARFSEAYDARALHKALKRAITRCNRERGQQKLEPIPSWFTYQLRHSAATRIRAAHGVEQARVLLGHTTAGMTEVYAEADMQRAAEVAELVG